MFHIPYNSWSRVLGIFTVCAVFLIAVVSFTGARAHGAEWQNITENLTGSIADYDGSIPGARGVGGLVVDRHSGAVMAGLCGPPYGFFMSADAGETWKRLDDGSIAGGWVRSAATQIDQNAPGRIAVFRAGPPAPMNDGGRPQPTSAMTLDGGKTWIPLDEGKVQFDLAGWLHGFVDWTKETPDLVLAQNRVRPSIFVSTDGGKDIGRRLGVAVQEVTWNHEYLIKEDGKNWADFREKTVKGYGACGGAILLGRWDTGIERSTDGGDNFEKVSDFLVAAHTPVLFQGKIYWGAEPGLIVSEDCGQTWQPHGAPLPNIVKGPFFGADANQMMVVTPEGIFGTMDAGANWRKIADHPEMPEAWRADADPVWLRRDYAWDHTRNILYAAGMAGPIYRMQLGQ